MLNIVSPRLLKRFTFEGQIDVFLNQEKSVMEVVPVLLWDYVGSTLESLGMWLLTQIGSGNGRCSRDLNLNCFRVVIPDPQVVRGVRARERWISFTSHLLEARPLHGGVRRTRNFGRQGNILPCATVNFGVRIKLSPEILILSHAEHGRLLGDDISRVLIERIIGAHEDGSPRNR